MAASIWFLFKLLRLTVYVILAHVYGSHKIAVGNELGVQGLGHFVVRYEIGETI